MMWQEPDKRVRTEQQRYNCNQDKEIGSASHLLYARQYVLFDLAQMTKTDTQPLASDLCSI